MAALVTRRLMPCSSAILERRVERDLRSVSASRIRSAIWYFAISPLSIFATSWVRTPVPTLGPTPATVGDPVHRAGVTSVTLHRARLRSNMRPVEGLLAAIAFVLIVGAVAGNVFASRRRRTPTISIYRLIRERLSEDRSPSGSS